jgi:hypothetical protein
MEMERCTKADDDDGAAFHKGMSESHLECGEACAKCAMSIKANAGDLTKLADVDDMVPLNVSVVTPPNPGIRAVPRAGAPAQSDHAEVPRQFEKMVAVDED